MTTGTPNNDLLSGTNSNNTIDALAGNDTIRGSRGNDTLTGGAGYDVVDYSALTAPITVQPAGVTLKGSLGTDQLIQVERIIAPSGQINTIDASLATGDVSIEINLAGNYFNVSGIPGIPILSVGIRNFVNAFGTDNDDYLMGSNGNNFLDAGTGNDGIDGGAGNDILIGCSGNDYLTGNRGADRIIGTNSYFRGAGEVDDLQGDAGNDRFVLGDVDGSYYTSHSGEDYAGIRDFSIGDRIELGIGETYQAERTDFGFNLYATTGGGNEFIAAVTTTSFVNLPIGSFTINSGQIRGIFIGA